MRAGSFQKKLLFRKSVDQNPIGPDVAVAATDPIPAKLVIAILWRQRFPCKKKVDHSFYFSEVFASLLHEFNVLFELLCLGDIHSSQEA
jgi:hypothetical protein